MEVAREVSAAASAVATSVALETSQKPAKRLRELAEEKKRWISRRQERLARKEELLKLLKLQDVENSKDVPTEAQKANNETKMAIVDTSKGGEKAAAVLARKKELKELQTRAKATLEKQQLLTQKLKQFTATRHVAEKASTQKVPTTKRKREGSDAEEQPSKKTDVGISETPKMHPFSAAPDLDVGTAELATATCFRIATRYFLASGMRIPRDVLDQAFKTYTSKRLDEVVDAFSLERSLACFNTDNTKPSIHRSSSTPQTRRVWWQPGRQFLKNPTVVSSDAEQIQTLINIEKQIVADVCDSILTPRKRQSASMELKTARRQQYFLASLLSDSTATPSSLALSNILSACVGVGLNEPTSGFTKRIIYRSHGQMASVFANMESWLREHAETIEPQDVASSRLLGVSGLREDEYFSKTRYATPFCIENDSVVKQLRGVGTQHTTDVKKIDPLKILCHYELNGVCNDKNCSNYHRKDYGPVVNTIDNLGGCAHDDDARVLNSMENDQLLLMFAEFRAKMMKKWPVITTAQISAMAEENANKSTSSANSMPAADSGSLVVDDAHYNDEAAQADSVDFIMLDTREELPEVGDARYFDDIESRKDYGDSLQEKVEQDPNDTDTWLLLAIYQLELDVGLNDEAMNLSDDTRLERQLVFLSKELTVKHPSDFNIEEANLKRCLYTLSRALEVEANAYCEALWLLYLHLCRQTAIKQTEVDMVEQAVQFLPSSHTLWLRYISTYDFDSVNMAEGIYSRLMEHLAGVNSTEEAVKTSNANPSKDLSILLTAMCCHLCIKLWRAGATSRAIELLSSLIQLGDVPLEFEWCGMVRSRLRSDEEIIFCLLLAHVLVFEELPPVIEHWVAASCQGTIPIKGMGYTVEFLQQAPLHVSKNCAQVWASYERAFSIYKEGGSEYQDAGAVILSNWMILLSLRSCKNPRDESLKDFFREKLDTIRQFPTASLTAAKLIGLTSGGDKQAHELMLTMMNQSSDKKFPEALHHYLFACRQSTALVNALDKTFPDVMERLASLLEFDIDAVEKSIQDIMRDTSNISKSRALKTLLDALLDAWIDHVNLLHRESKHHQTLDSHPKSLADVYVALAICQLMGILLEASVAIESLQRILSIPSFGVLSFEARQLAWMQRFVFEVDLLQQDDSDGVSWKIHQASLIQLFRKYMSEMNVQSEMQRQVLKRVKRDLGRNALEDAVCDCIYPERTCLITYDIHLELFRLCSAAVPGPEKTAFYASFTDTLSLTSEFSLAFSDIVVHEWELLAARASLRKCLGGSKTQYPQVLQALVALELRLRNMKSISSLLLREMLEDPLRIEIWRLVVGLEILVGDKLAERSESIAAEMEKRQLVFRCNTFGDDQVTDDVVSSLAKSPNAVTTLTFRGLGLEYIPNAVLLKNELISLDVTGNELMELPIGLGLLQNVQQLNASENALIEFPPCISCMENLKELRLAHNNISTVSTPRLANLSTLDISWNSVKHLAVSDLHAHKSIEMLRTDGNAIPAEELSKICDLLSRRESSTSYDRKPSKSTQSPPELTGVSPSKKQSTNALSSGSSSAEQIEDSTVFTPCSTNTEAGEPVSVSISTVSADADSTTTISITRMGDEDQVMNAEQRGDEDQVMDAGETAAKGYDGDQVMDDNEAIHAPCVMEDSTDEAVDAHVLKSTPPAKENAIDKTPGEMSTFPDSKTNSSDHIMEIDSVASNGSAATMMPTTIKAATQQSNEVIDVDSSDSLEADGEAQEQVATVSNSNEVSSNLNMNQEVVPNTLAKDGSSTEHTFEAEDFAQEHSVASTGTQGTDPEAADAVLTKLTTYMEQNQIHNRAEVRRQNPALWQEFVDANTSGATGVAPCRLCFAPSDGSHQRLNSRVLCLHCLEQTLHVLKKRSGDLNQ